MPYITPKAREQYAEVLEELWRTLPDNPKGHLTYVLYHIASDWIAGRRDYQNISDACAALRDAEAELRRRVLNPYEDAKRKLNGGIE